MERSELQAKIADLEQQIAELPAGSVTKKTINGNVYFYHRWTEDKKRREKYIPTEEVDSFRKQIERRKGLEKELKVLQKQLPRKSLSAASAHTFATNIRTGEALRSFAASVRGYRRRECFQQLHDFVYGEPQDKVFILYGLRRTGKTTMIRQIFAEMSDTELAKAAFIQITAKDTLADVNRDLKALEAQGFHYVSLDEVTLMEDFIEGAALFSDVFAACGMKIVLSGTDSLGFLFTEDEQLYDRCILLHTTFIPYREFESVLGIHGIDEYIRYGGTMSLGGVHYNETSTFASKESTDEYVDTAIARNIQHSLRCYQYEGHFRQQPAPGSEEPDGHPRPHRPCACHRQPAEAAGNPQQGGTNRKTGRGSCGGDQGVSGLAGLNAGDRRAAPAGCQHEVQPHGDRTAGSPLCAGGCADPQPAAG